MTPQNRLMIAALVGIALMAGVAGALYRRHATAPVVLDTGTYLPESRRLADFSLIDHHGRTFASTDLKGSWSMLFFGYTNCPDLCPATLSTLAELEKRLRAAGTAVRPRVIFVSVDAKRDTPAQLANYVPYFDPEFLGLTASTQPGVDAVAAEFGAVAIITPRPGGAYSVDHTGAIFVVNPAGRLTAILTGPFTVDHLQRDFARLVAADS